MSARTSLPRLRFAGDDEDALPPGFYDSTDHRFYRSVTCRSVFRVGRQRADASRTFPGAAYAAGMRSRATVSRSKALLRRSVSSAACRSVKSTAAEKACA